ncbi:hypothetical protein ACEPAG_6805 [Sanghuangporus baumii]
MFIATTTALLLLGFAALKGTFFWCINAQQATNATIALLPEFSGLPISGEVVGTGVDGTTYVLSASGTGAGDIPFTMTVVQDASTSTQPSAGGSATSSGSADSSSNTSGTVHSFTLSLSAVFSIILAVIATV